MSKKSADPPKPGKRQRQEGRWSLTDGPTFHRSLPEDATEEEKADFISYPWFYNWFAKDDAPTTYTVSTFKRSQPSAEPGSRSEAPQPTPDDSAAARPNTNEPEASGQVDPKPGE